MFVDASPNSDVASQTQGRDEGFATSCSRRRLRSQSQPCHESLNRAFDDSNCLSGPAPEQS